MSRNAYAVLALLLTVYTVLAIFHPGGLMAYALPSICWGLLALTTLWICGLKKMQSWFNKRIFFMAVLIAVFQIFALIDAGLINSFGKSPISFTPTSLMINLMLVLSTLLGTELSRAYLMKNFAKKKPFLTLGLVTFLYTFINVSVFGFLTLLTANEPLRLADFLGASFLPIVAENLLASYLVLLGGPTASIAYRGLLQAFQWFSPILPDLPWGFEALIGVMIPTIGFITINQVALPPTLLKKIGIFTQTKKLRRFAKTRKPSIRGWTIVSILCVLMVWGSTGLLGFYITIPLSGSMRPTVDTGDIALVISTDPSSIQVGDIIQYWQDGEMTLHRIVEIQHEGGISSFVTKGDDNLQPDTDPILAAQIRGKLVFIIPKLGWIPIYFRTTIANIWSFFSTSAILAYATLSAVIIMTSIYVIRTIKSRPHRYWQRKRGW
ncbi:MAG: signal peptidase I [Candidatus Bathyarchaeota archaeon]|nr:signal peptidase I [Candidatus Bathyarchaeota archaeon]MDH5531848.1 signal peptidase I [Candidatus Bathyarchaeota archaeon]MDH5712368.1 signal peptidase I [Candidatus Bathyarchaeota archaeon]